MLVIRLSRTGKRNQPAYRMVVAEHSSPVQGKCQEIVGFYLPAEDKKLEFKMDRIEHWIKMGAKPSDTVASLLKAKGVPNMESFIGRRNLKRKKKDGSDDLVETAAPAAAEAPAQEAPAAEETPSA